MRRFDEDENMFKTMIGSKENMGEYMVYNLLPEFGHGSITSYDVMPGIEITYNDFHIYKTLNENFDLSTDSLEINYCLEGYLESEFANKNIVYMGDGDISIFGYKTGVVLADFTTKHYRGITMILYIEEASKSIGNMLGEPAVKIEKSIRGNFNDDTCIVNHASQSLEHIFREFFVLPEKFKNQFLKLKSVELLLYILAHTDYKIGEKKYFPRSFVDKIKDARGILVSNMDSHITIKELSERIGMNPTDMQRGFKEIYQASIYNYMKSYRMKKARELLVKESLTVSEIGNLVGYTNNSKFSRAFREEFGITPLKYRISNR